MIKKQIVTTRNGGNQVILDSRVLYLSQAQQALNAAAHGSARRQWELFENLENDDLARTLMANRRATIASQEFIIESSDNGFVKAMEEFSWSGLFYDLSHAIGFGLAVVQFDYASDGKYIIPTARKLHNAKLFGYDREASQVTLENSPDVIDPYQFAMHFNGGLSANPLISGIYRSLVVPYISKQIARRGFARFVDRYGTLDRTLFHTMTDEIKVRKVKASLVESQETGVAMVYGASKDDMDTSPSVTGTSEPFTAMIEDANRSISLLITGSDSNGKASSSSIAEATIRDEARQRLIEFDFNSLVDSLNNGYLKYLADLNDIDYIKIAIPKKQNRRAPKTISKVKNK